jgi:hypothetical protein
VPCCEQAPKPAAELASELDDRYHDEVDEHREEHEYPLQREDERLGDPGDRGDGEWHGWAL